MSKIIVSGLFPEELKGFKSGCKDLHVRAKRMVDILVENGFVYNKILKEIDSLIENDDWKTLLDNYKYKLNACERFKRNYEITKALSFYEIYFAEKVIEGISEDEIKFDYELLQKLANIKNYLFSLQIELNHKLFENRNISE